jgi:AcrR family transcriptional regulator
MGRPREHGPETRAALLSVAARLLGAEGAAGVTIRRVADETGTSTRAVYSLFGDKQGLMRALFHEAAETMRRHHEAVPVTADPISEIGQLALAYRAAALEQPFLYDLYLGRVGPDVELTEADLALAFRSFQRVLDTLHRAAGAGLLGGRDPEVVGRQMWALVHGLASLELLGFLGTADQTRARWTDAVDTSLAGYASPPRPRT